MEWIKIEEGCQLPKVGDLVLLTLCYAKSSKYRLVSAIEIHDTDDIERLKAGKDPFKSKWDTLWATAWMPCPAPYREVQP